LRRPTAGVPWNQVESLQGSDTDVTVKERIQESSISVVESDFANDRETIAALRRRTHPPKPARKFWRRRLAA
jgi:hypothetical protein